MQWEIKANELLTRLVGIWQGKEDPAVLFRDKGFVTAFQQVVEQYLAYCGFPAPDLELGACLIRRRIAFAARHGHEPAFTSQAKEAEWIAEAAALELWKKDLINNEIITACLRIAYAIEDILTTCSALPTDYLQSIDELLGKPLPRLNLRSAQPAVDNVEEIERFEAGLP